MQIPGLFKTRGQIQGLFKTRGQIQGLFNTDQRMNTGKEKLLANTVMRDSVMQISISVIMLEILVGI